MSRAFFQKFPLDFCFFAILKNIEQKNHGSPSFINIAALLLFAIVIAVVSAVTTYFVLNSRSNEQYSTAQPSVVPPQTYVQPTSPPVETTNQTVLDEMEDWKVYRNERYKFEFKYPSFYGEAEFLRRNCSDSGELFRISFSNNKSILFGGDSVDCQEGRGAGWTDFNYYTKLSDGRYRYHFAEKSFELVPSKIIEPLSILIISNQNLGLALRLY